ncbi:MAG: Gldg family protein [Gammaproteobacteria bacterium]|nr:Gldg family protein [Gammaproteobacteria bacterium]
MSKQWLSISSLAIAVILFFAVNIFSNAALTRWRADLTENNLYTLAEGTRSILGGLDEPITLRLFLSSEISSSAHAVATYARRVQDLLREYDRYAGDRIDLEVIDPEPFSEEEDRAQRHGLRSLPLNDGGDPLYFGLVGSNTVDDTEVIPFFSPQREKLLEYDLTRLVYQLNQTEPPVVGLVSSLPLNPPLRMGQTQRQSWLIVDQIEKLFAVENIDAGSGPIPEDVDVLMVVHPRELSAGMLYAIDQFVLSGGRALVFVDPYMETEARGRGQATSASDLAPLFRQWGLELEDGKVASDMRFAERVRYQRDERQVVGEFPVWLNLDPDQFNADDVVTASLGNVFMATPGVLRKRDGAASEFTPLIRTSDEAMDLDTSVITEAATPAAIIEAYEPGSESLTLAARVSGRAETAYPDGPPEPESRDQASGEDRNQAGPVGQAVSGGDINVVVVADADMLHEQFWASRRNVLGNDILVPSSSNADFVINTLENLTGSGDLISVRSRGEFTRPFTKVVEIRRAAELQYRQKEQQLLDRLEETERALLELEQGRRNDQNQLMLTGEQQQEIEKFRREKVRIRQELREVQHQLRSDIETLEGWLKFVNIGLLPLVIVVGAGVVGLRRTRGRNR